MFVVGRWFWVWTVLDRVSAARLLRSSAFVWAEGDDSPTFCHFHAPLSAPGIPRCVIGALGSPPLRWGEGGLLGRTLPWPSRIEGEGVCFRLCDGGEVVGVPAFPLGPFAVVVLVDDGVCAVGHSGSASVVEFASCEVVEDGADGSGVQEGDYSLAVLRFGVCEHLGEALLDALRELFWVFAAEL